MVNHFVAKFKKNKLFCAFAEQDKTLTSSHLYLNYVFACANISTDMRVSNPVHVTVAVALLLQYLCNLALLMSRCA